MRVLLFGIYALGARALARLREQDHRVVGVVTKPDQGRGQKDLLELVDQMGLPLFQPESLRDPEFAGTLASLQPDLLAVAGYHLRIPRFLLGLPRLGAINTHLSLLPQYRGPCPWKWAIIRGERKTGVTVHVLTPHFDQGEILAQREIPLGDEETGETLFHRLAVEGAGALAETIRMIEAGTASRRHQDEGSASYYGAPTDEEARIRWNEGAREIRNLIRGLHPRPGAWTTHAGRRVRIAGGAVVETSGDRFRTGLIVDSGEDLVTVSTGRGFLTAHGLTVEGPGGEVLPVRAGEFPIGSIFGQD